MFISVRDTKFKQYLQIINDRKKVAVAAFDYNGPHYNRVQLENSVMDFIEYDVFINFRIPSIENLEVLREQFNKGTLTSHSLTNTETEQVIFSNSHLTLYKLGIESVACSYSTLGKTYCYPRLGIENGYVDSLEKFLFLHFSNIQIISYEDLGINLI